MLSPYTGQWTFDEAAHLLRRTIFGPTKSRIQQAVDEGFDATFATLFAEPAVVDPPIYYDFEDDPEAGIGETWVDKPLDGSVTGIYFARSKTLWAWWFMQMKKNDQTITEKLTLFWHNHFVISEAGNANMNWEYLTKLRDFALGDFKELTKQITIDRSMLIYLNGTTNFADEPNENYARELLELFTLGKGPLVAPGDYTNYTEQDIAAIARALTGWSAWSGDDPNAIFYYTWGHDKNDKQLSHRFNNQIIVDEGEEEYKTVIDIIFEKDEVAHHICRRLYLWFVHYEITDTIEHFGDDVGRSLSHAAVNVIKTAVANVPVIGGIVHSIISVDTLVRDIEDVLGMNHESLTGLEKSPKNILKQLRDSLT